MIDFAHDGDLSGMFDESARIEAARMDPNAFVSYVFLDNKPQHRFHAEWQWTYTKEDAVVIFSAVEHGKTEQISVWRTLFELGCNPELRFWILSSTNKLASKICTQLEQIILTNDRLHRVFPNLKPEDRRGRAQAWNTTSFIIRRESDSRDPSVQTCGITGSAIGSRIDRLICDDITNFRNAYFDAQRERSVEWFKGAECMGRLTAGAKVIMVNNAWHDRALPHVVVNELGFLEKSYPACDENLNGILWPLETSRGKVVGFDKARLAQKRKMMGLVEFARCFLCQPISDHTEFFSVSKMSRNLMKGLKPFAELPKGMIPICGVDPAVSKKNRSNEACFFVGGVDPRTGMKRVRYIISKRMSAIEIVKEMLNVYRHEPNVRIVVENNAQQDYLIQIVCNGDIMKAVGANEHEAARLRGCIRPFTTTDKKSDPDVGIAGMASDFEACTWEIPDYQETEKWFRQAIAYRPGVHTGDVLMASYFFWSEANRLSTRRATVPESMKDFMKRVKPITELSGLYTERF